MNPAQKLLEKLKAIDRVEEFYETSTKNKFYIIDVDETAILTDTCADINGCFSIINPSLKTIYFIPVDGKGIIGKTMPCCEAVIFNDMHFSFLELKLNATSQTRRAIYRNRIEAVSQLENTIKFFDEKLDSSYEGILLEAIIATPKFYPRLNSSWIDIADEFLEKNRITLIEVIEKTY